MNLFSFHSIILASIIIFITAFYGKDFTHFFTQPFSIPQKPQGTEYANAENVGVAFAAREKEKEKGCNLFEGVWVYEEKKRPLYEEHECPYIEEKIRCQAHGRPDKGYMHWRWQPHGCSLPRFDAKFMLEMLRGKRMMFVGDSLNRGQFSSMVCLLQRVIPRQAKSFLELNSSYVFKAKEYNASIEFYWAPFLLESNCDNFYYHRFADRTVRAGSINVHAQHWTAADILVIDTYIWWMTGLKLNIIKGETPEGDTQRVKMEPEDAYRMGMKELVAWVEKNMDPHKNRVFFVTMSSSHSLGREWGGDQNSSCYNETTLIEDPNFWGSYSRKEIMQREAHFVKEKGKSLQLLREEFNASKVPITVLNITQLSEYRKDAHLSIYKPKEFTSSPAQLGNPSSYADCFHWCVPGVPDTWNELLYAMLFYP